MEGILRFKMGWSRQNSLKQLKTANPNSPWAYIQEGFIGRIFESEIWGGGRAYFWESLFWRGLSELFSTLWENTCMYYAYSQSVLRVNSKLKDLT